MHFKEEVYSSKLKKALLYSGKLSPKQKEGLKILEESAEKNNCQAIRLLTKYYSNTNNKDKEFYYLKKAALMGSVSEKLVYYCIARKRFKRARKYFALYIQDRKNSIRQIEKNEIELKDETGVIEKGNRKKREYYIRLLKQSIEKDKSFFLEAIRKAEKDENFVDVSLKLRNLSRYLNVIPKHEIF